MQNRIISVLGIPSGSSVFDVSFPVFLLVRHFSLSQKLSFWGCLALFLGFFVDFFSILLFAIRFYRIYCANLVEKNIKGDFLSFFFLIL